MDDFITGADSLQEILDIRNEVINLLILRGFNIMHWASNHSYALKNIEQHFIDLNHLVKTDSILNVSGIVWDSRLDLLTYKINTPSLKLSCTKRISFSEVAKIFDTL